MARRAGLCRPCAHGASCRVESRNFRPGRYPRGRSEWIPAFAGMTAGGRSFPRSGRRVVGSGVVLLPPPALSVAKREGWCRGRLSLIRHAAVTGRRTSDSEIVAHDSPSTAHIPALQPRRRTPKPYRFDVLVTRRWTGSAAILATPIAISTQSPMSTRSCCNDLRRDPA